jgi:hypothetical protein
MYAYFAGVLCFLFIYGLFFAFVRKSRKPMLWASLALGHAGPISEHWHVKDYWNPDYLLKIRIGSWSFGIEDYLYAFAFAGLCAGILDLLARRSGYKELANFELLGFVKLMLFGLACLLAMVALVELLDFNSLHGIVIAFIFAATVILMRQRKLLVCALQTAFIVAAVVWIFYAGFFSRFFPAIMDEWWQVDAMSGVALGGVAIEEVLWAWAAALFAGTALRHCMDMSGGQKAS